MARGSAFHSLGASTEKALSPMDFNLDEGCFRRSESDKRRVREGLYGVINSHKYEGAVPCTAL